MLSLPGTFRFPMFLFVELCRLNPSLDLHHASSSLTRSLQSSSRRVLWTFLFRWTNGSLVNPRIDFHQKSRWTHSRAIGCSSILLDRRDRRSISCGHVHSLRLTCNSLRAYHVCLPLLLCRVFYPWNPILLDIFPLWHSLTFISVSTVLECHQVVGSDHSCTLLSSLIAAGLHWDRFHLWFQISVLKHNLAGVQAS